MANTPVAHRSGRTIPANELAPLGSATQPAANESIAIPPPAPPLGLSMAPDAMLCLTRDGIVCDVSVRAATLFGYHAKLMTGAHVGAFVTASSEGAVNAPASQDLLRQMALGDGAPIEAVAHTLAGARLAVEITTSCYTHAGVDYILSALRDISHRKQNESVLLEAKEVAERANVAKLEFLSQLSHELRTPLAAVIGFGEVMRDEMFGPLGIKLYQSYAADICQSGQQLADVVERIIDVSRLEGRMATAHARTADIGEIVERVIERTAAEASKQNVRLINNVRRGSMPVILDDETLQKMIGHVVDNAVAFNRFGGKVEISAAAEQNNKEGNLIQLAVTDTGAGMLPDKLGELRRALDGASKEGSGGLELCAAFLHLIGGSLDICSAPNLGTTVTLIFPRRYDGRWRP
jgi:PAS domain S-box-containing protein